MSRRWGKKCNQDLASQGGGKEDSGFLDWKQFKMQNPQGHFRPQEELNSKQVEKFRQWPAADLSYDFPIIFYYAIKTWTWSPSSSQDLRLKVKLNPLSVCKSSVCRKFWEKEWERKVSRESLASRWKFSVLRTSLRNYLQSSLGSSLDRKGAWIEYTRPDKIGGN